MPPHEHHHGEAVLRRPPSPLSKDDIIRGIPKAELHLHLEGTLEPEMMFEIAQRNNIQLEYSSPDEIRAAFQFTDLQSFLDIYYKSASVLIKEQDFYDLTYAYLVRAKKDGVVHAEMFFDPQTHTARGVDIGTVVRGLDAARRDAGERLGISTHLIMCFVRHESEEAAMEALEAALPFKELITGVGLDSGEVGNPPEKFKRVYERAIAEGLLPVAHAGEEGPPEYIWGALNELKVKRIDHGIRCLEDPLLVEHLVSARIPLTVCPLSNVKLKVFESLKDHTLKKMLALGLVVTANSDDPAFFGGYIGDNYIALANELGLSMDDLYQLAENSFFASFLEEGQRQGFLQMLLKYRKRSVSLSRPLSPRRPVVEIEEVTEEGVSRESVSPTFASDAVNPSCMPLAQLLPCLFIRK